MPSDLTLPAADGFPLAATRFDPAGDPGRVVLVAPATGVRRKLYRPLAEFLAGEGFAVLTWDWRGTGGSRPPSLRGFRATMRDWAERDLAGAIDHAAERWPGASLFALGHSFGGQAIGLAPNAPRLRALVTVAAQSGWWGHWPASTKLAYAALWKVVMPLTTRALGRFPMRRLGMGEDLPAGVALEWARWCSRPEYLGDWSGHAALTLPILAFSFADDPFAPRAAVEALHARYGSRALTRRHVAPAEVGAKRIGHFGFFRPGVAPGLWREAADWMSAR
ncbi:MAG TPA: alpha/beta fold hydrolase [Longimicrobiaceae bacterium]|nr:alpha/beta fold hydrolase [Longimicrobiaceae bacterium]